MIVAYNLASLRERAEENRWTICWSTVYGYSHTKYIPIVKDQNVWRMWGSGSKLYKKIDVSVWHTHWFCLGRKLDNRSVFLRKNCYKDKYMYRTQRNLSSRLGSLCSTTAQGHPPLYIPEEIFIAWNLIILYDYCELIVFFNSGI